MSVDQTPCGIRLLLDEPLPGGHRVGVDRFFRRQLAVAFAEAAIIDREHGEAELVQLFDAAELSGQIPPRAVEIKDGGRIGLLRGPPPRVDLGRIFLHADGQIDLANTIGNAGKPSCRNSRRTERQLPLAVFELHAAAGEGGEHTAGDQQAQHGRIGPKSWGHESAARNGTLRITRQPSGRWTRRNALTNLRVR